MYQTSAKEASFLCMIDYILYHKNDKRKPFAENALKIYVFKKTHMSIAPPAHCIY